MTLDQLKYFYEAARFQHIGKAAQFVHISPSAISAAVASLESELNCKLFDRIGKSIVLTDSGKRLKEESERLFDQVQAMKGAVQGMEEQLRGDYRLGGSHFLASHYLSTAWSKLQNIHPGLHGEITSLSTSQALRELVNGQLDFALCFSPFQHPELKQIEIHKGRLVIAVRSGHPLLKTKGRKAILQLSHLPAAIHKGQPGVELCVAHPIFARYGIVPYISMSFDNDACAIQRVATSDSWTMIPEIVAKEYSRQVKTIDLPPDWDASYFVALVFRNDREKNPSIQKIKILLERLFDKTKPSSTRRR